MVVGQNQKTLRRRRVRAEKRGLVVRFERTGEREGGLTSSTSEVERCKDAEQYNLCPEHLVDPFVARGAAEHKQEREGEDTGEEARNEELDEDIVVEAIKPLRIGDVHGSDYPRNRRPEPGE